MKVPKLERFSNTYYINVFSYFNPKYVYNFFIGGRGTGKTYSSLLGLMHYTESFLFLRRTNDEVERLMDTPRSYALSNPFSIYNGKEPDLARYCLYGNGKFARICEYEDGGNDSEERFYHDAYPKGFASSLYAMQKRGIEMPQIEAIYLDEFMRKVNERRMFQNEYTAFCEIYDSIARNREIEGKPPVYAIFTSNSNSIYNDYFKELHIVNDLERKIKAARDNGEKSVDAFYPEKSVALHILPDSKEFISYRSSSAIGKFSAGTTYANMAIGNEFAYDDFEQIKVIKIQGFIPLCAYGDAYFYKKKSEDLFYCSYSVAHCRRYKTTKIDTSGFYCDYAQKLFAKYQQGHLYFESFELKMLFMSVVIG